MTEPPRYDAGMRNLDHYSSRLPKWRYAVRQWLIPIVRWETPYLAYMQEKLRSPALDSYFAFTANLGTHTFFMVMLPILFWCGYTNLGRAMVHVLASGVFWSGFVKDMMCLPRPLSPPLTRITMSGSAALEYGFPSTHSTNAVSVAWYAIDMLRANRDSGDSSTYLMFQLAFYWYAVSIIFGRLYCGMHGFFDVVIGAGLGALMSAVQVAYGDAFDRWICAEGGTNILIVILVILVLVRVHPEPADDCPCFDDSVSFAGVVIGCEVGLWHFSGTRFASSEPVPGTVPFDIDSVGWMRATARIILGVLIIFAWRGFSKKLMFKVLPPVFRILERLQWNLPRRFFLDASKYSSVPSLRRDDNVIPSASEIPSMLNNLSHPRKRAVSIGPQSMADAYETLAYRQRRRRESLTSNDGDVRARSPVKSHSPDGKENYFSLDVPKSTSSSTLGTPAGVNLLPTPAASRVSSYEQMMGAGKVDPSLITPPTSDTSVNGESEQSSDRRQEEKEEREMFSKLEKPRVRYDVEVITKLVVYSGIGWLAVEGNPILFALCGLGGGLV
ncbi:sphingosine-1-phosphate phosphohydrolase [Saccharata proteae CBS 121410]|uniref:Sphingosine-1-phosphate phosphohydrolase n=1 Tax=Saccharata proteae CBS 121410 TaxID=1314787 RepID=A0A9P4HNX0_9PEZI|nr:sphingosine-1-phosphate phosphohydrolase [Saccharata proteae CBS 121410]